MNPTRVIIEKLPKSPFSTFIAIIALSVSIISLWWTRIDVVESKRPFIWAVNYYTKDSTGIVPVPEAVMFRVINFPAKIIKVEVKIKYKTETLFSEARENDFQFPNDNPTEEWHFAIGDEQAWKKILKRPNEENYNLRREISVIYSSLNGGKEYHYKLLQSFDPAYNQWDDLSKYSE
jgi:hypothetical protein